MGGWAALVGAKRLIEKIAVSEMLKHEAIGIFPVIECLAAQNVLTHTKGVLVSCFLQRVVALHQHIPISDFKCSMVEIRMTCVYEKHRMVIHILLTSVAAREGP